MYTLWKSKWRSLSHVWLFVTPWTVYWSQNTGVSRLSHLQGIFSIQGSNPDLPHCRQILYQLSHKGGPSILECVAYSFTSGSSQPRSHPSLSVRECVPRVLTRRRPKQWHALPCVLVFTEAVLEHLVLPVHTLSHVRFANWCFSDKQPGALRVGLVTAAGIRLFDQLQLRCFGTTHLSWLTLQLLLL